MKTIVIAEIGVNHNGDIAIARRLIDAAAEAKADYVKFQTFVPEKLASAAAPQAAYQRQNQPETTDENQLDMLRRLALSETDFYLLADYCASRGIGFLSSPFDQESIDLLLRLDIDTWKIPSGEITNYPYLVQIARSGKPIILSTGMSSLEEIGEALSVLTANGLTKEKITLLHCTTEYPAPYEDVHLHAMRRLGEIFGVKTGYSDHTEGTAPEGGAGPQSLHRTRRAETAGSLYPGRRKSLRGRDQATPRRRSGEPGRSPQKHCGGHRDPSRRTVHRKQPDDQTAGNRYFSDEMERNHRNSGKQRL